MKKIVSILKRVFIVIFFLVLIVSLGIFMVKYLNPTIGKAPDASKIKSSNFNGKTFINPIPTKAGGLGDAPKIIKDYVTRKVESSPKSTYLFNEQKNDSIGNGKVHLNWLGHAAVLLEKNNQYILLDPMLGERASPFSFMGPKRYSPSPIAPEDLPEIEAVVISHDHYDHLDYSTIKTIHPKVKMFLVPLGVGATLRYWDVPDSKIKEMDWHNNYQTDNFNITATPARHFSGRLFTQNNTLWASWVIDYSDEKVYFGGDTGIFNGFKDIGDKYGPFDLSLIPIGAYNPSWHDIHMDPIEGIDAFHQLGGGKFLPIHWGTFDLAIHSWYEPIELLTASDQINKENLITPKPGEWITPSTYLPNLDWWKEYSNKF